MERQKVVNEGQRGQKEHTNGYNLHLNSSDFHRPSWRNKSAR
jgi:hypothetical protein